MTGDSDTPPRQLRILAIHRYYWPDTPPYASMLRCIVASWSQAGHEVDVLSSQPSYKAALDNQKLPPHDQLDGASVTRLTLPSEAGRPLVRIFNAVKLCFAIWARALFGRRYDVIMVSTAPPVVAGFACALVTKIRETRFIYHCMDIHPEIGRISGEFRRPVVFRFLQGMDQWSCRQASPVVVLSEDMRKTLESRKGGDRINIAVINNFSLPSDEEVCEKLPFSMDSGGFNLIFAGNIGRFQGLHALIEAMALLSDRPDIRLIMMGEGVAKNELEVLAQKLGANVQFVGHHPVSVAKLAMQKADAGFISLAPDIYRYAYPSKTMTYLEQGCPLIVAVESESSLAKEVEANQLGAAVEAGSSESIAKGILSMADGSGRLQEMKATAGAWGRGHYSESEVLPLWLKLLEHSDK